MARTEAPQPEDQQDAEAKAAADELAKSGKQSQEEKAKQPSEPVTTTTDDEGNQVVVGDPNNQTVNGPEDYNPARPGVSPDWPAAKTIDEEHDVGQNDGVTQEELEAAQAQREEAQAQQAQQSQPAQQTQENKPETAEQP